MSTEVLKCYCKLFCDVLRSAKPIRPYLDYEIRLLRSKKNKKKDHGVWIPLVQGTQIIAIDSLNTASGM